MKKILKIFIVSIMALNSINSYGAGAATEPKKIIWPFDGFFGKFDRRAIQRGFQVYKEVCSSCHGLYHLYYRNLKEVGFSDKEISELAKNFKVKDGPDDQGEMFERPALPSDLFVPPFANEQAARASNNNAYPVDLSLITIARKDGPNYVYSLLTGYSNPPSDLKVSDGLYYNQYFPGGLLAMAPPLMEGIVTYSDGTPASVDQMAKDVTIFLQWAAEPEMEHRKSMGLKVMIYLFIFTFLFYIAKNRIWSRIGRDENK